MEQRRAARPHPLRMTPTAHPRAPVKHAPTEHHRRALTRWAALTGDTAPGADVHGPDERRPDPLRPPPARPLSPASSGALDRDDRAGGLEDDLLGDAAHDQLHRGRAPAHRDDDEVGAELG